MAIAIAIQVTGLPSRRLKWKPRRSLASSGAVPLWRGVLGRASALGGRAYRPRMQMGLHERVRRVAKWEKVG